MKKQTGNKTEDKKKIEIIDRFCAHLEKGHSEYSFAEYDFRDIEEFAKSLDNKNGNNLQVERIKKSLRKSFLYWENIAFQIKEDESKKYFFPLWIFYMKSRFQFGAEDKKTDREKMQNIEVHLCSDNDVKEIDR